MRIVVASHHLFRRELSSFILSEAGYTVYEACNCQELMHHLMDTPIDMILLDERLPGIDQHDMIQSLHQYASLPIIVITNGFPSLSGMHDEMLSLLSDSVKTSVTWPYQADDLLSNIESLVHRCAPHPCLTHGELVPL